MTIFEALRLYKLINKLIKKLKEANIMKGWKTWAGAALIGLSAAVRALGINEIADILYAAGLALMGVGIAHKVEKAVNGGVK